MSEEKDKDIFSTALISMEEERSNSLLQFMASEKLFLSPEDEDKRASVIKKLNEILLAWVKKVAWQRRLPKQQIAAASATLLIYGSYCLGVHDSESDIDAVCVGPFFATMKEDFFIVLRNMLESRPEVSEIQCVKDAKIPLIRLKFDGILVDLPYVQLKVLSVSENVAIYNPLLVKQIDETSWKSLSGVRLNRRILQLVSNIESFQSMLRCIKFWAKNRGVYGNLNGFFGGVHLAILAAFVCQSHPDASLSVLILNFFKTMAFWPWPEPIMLQDGTAQPTAGDPTGKRSLMPIHLPCTPGEYCRDNITKSTFYKIRAEFLRGHNFTRDLSRLDFDWNVVFEPFLYSKKYGRFVKIYLSASNPDKLQDWVGWVKSRIRSLILKLEEVHGMCDPNPTAYGDNDSSEPNVVFYWGLQPGKTSVVDMESVKMDFMKTVSKGYEGSLGKIELSIVPVSKLRQNGLFDTAVRGKERKAGCKILDDKHERIPVYSQHLANYVVGYVAKIETNNPRCEED